MKNTNKTPYSKSFIRTIGRYQLTFFFVIVIVGLSGAVITLNQIVEHASDTDGYKSSLDASNFDQATIDRVKQLRSSNETPVSFSPPAGRVSPFAE